MLFPTRRIVVCGLLVALGVVLGGLLKIPVLIFGGYNLKLSLGIAPVIIAAVLYGPVYGALCGALCDLLGAIIAPVGGYNPAFTIVGALLGAIPALFFLGKMHRPRVTFPRLLLAIAVSQLTGSVILNSLLLVFLYGSPWAIFIPRTLTQLCMIPILSLVCYGVIKALQRSGLRLE